ncbi:MAG: hypothetical protein M3O91_02755 [Chloroflexota bacterium]|nr:hypothetical protein [Chloroflexota bacterium]
MVRFPVSESNSLPALLEASGLRTAHEISAHDYRHVSLVTETKPRAPFQRESAERRAAKR